LDHYSLQLYTRVHNSTNKKSEAGPYCKKSPSMFDNDEKCLPQFGTMPQGGVENSAYSELKACELSEDVNMKI